MTHLHLDIYPTKVNASGVLGIFVYSKGGISGWTGIEISDIKANEWNSIDIDLSKYTSNPLSPISALVVSGGVQTKNENNAGGGFVALPEETEIYVANAYFYSDGTNPLLNAYVKERTSNSVTLSIKGIKSKDATGNDISYTISYNGQNTASTGTIISGAEQDITINNLTENTDYTFTIKIEDSANKNAETSVSTKTLLESAAAPTSVPDIKDDIFALKELYIKGTANNGFNWQKWGSPVETGKEESIGNDKAFLIEYFDYYGANFTEFDATDYTLHVDIYPLQDMQLAIIPITNNGVNKDTYGKTFSDLKKGEWKSLEIELNDLTNLDLQNFIQIKFAMSANADGTPAPQNGDGSRSFYIGNIYLYNNAVDDGEDPVIKYADVSNTTAASATFSIVATDNSEDLTFKVEAKDEHGNPITGTANGKSGNTVYVTLKGLELNTAYTATVTVSDKTRTSEEKTLTFTTKQLPHAIEPNASTFYYKNNQKEELNGFLAEGTGFETYGGFVDEINIGDNDNVLKFSGKNNVFGLRIKQDQEFNDKEHIVGIAIYPIDITEIQIAPRIWQETDNYKTIHVNANEWNYITIKPLENYTGGNKFIGFMIKGADGNTVFVDNFYMYTSDDVTAPTVTLNDISDTDVHVNSVKISFSGSDETSENVKYEIWLKNTTDNETEYQAGFTTAANNKKVNYYLKGLKAGKTYEICVKGRDEAENIGKSESKTFTTKSYTENISISNSEPTDANGGLVVLKGKWNVEEFNKIAAEYPYGCFDVRNVQFDDGLRHDRGEDGIKLFNHNAYFITDIGNNFDGNYAIPDEEGKLIGMNFQWFDGDFKPNKGPAGYVDYETIIDEYKTAHSTDTYPGLSDLGYIKMDPYTGYDLYFKEQGASITRQMNINQTVETTEGSNKYSTMICPFALNTDKVENCDFFRLNAPSVNEETVTLNFTQVTGKTEANKPYLLKVVNDGRGGTAYFVDNAGDTEKKLSFTDIENKKEIDGQTAKDGNVSATLFGTYVTQTFNTETTPKTSEVYGLKQDNDKLTLISSNTRSVLPAFRAAVKITGLPARAKYIVLSFDGETTGISSISDDAVTSILGNVYSIDGKIVGNTRNGLVHLPAGIYIVNGKKVVIK